MTDIAKVQSLYISPVHSSHLNGLLEKITFLRSQKFLLRADPAVSLICADITAGHDCFRDGNMLRANGWTWKSVVEYYDESVNAATYFSWDYSKICLIIPWHNREINPRAPSRTLYLEAFTNRKNRLFCCYRLNVSQLCRQVSCVKILDSTSAVEW